MDGRYYADTAEADFKLKGADIIYGFAKSNNPNTPDEYIYMHKQGRHQRTETTKTLIAKGDTSHQNLMNALEVLLVLFKFTHRTKQPLYAFLPELQRMLGKLFPSEEVFRSSKAKSIHWATYLTVTDSITEALEFDEFMAPLVSWSAQGAIKEMSPTRGSANLKRSTLSTHHNDPEAPPLKKPTPQPSPSSRPPNSTSTAPAANEPKPGPQSNSNSLASHRKSDTVPPEGTTTAQKNVPPVAVPNDKNPKIARRSYPPSSGRRPSSVTPVSPTLPKVPTTETTEKLNQSLQKLTSSGSEKGPGVANGDTTSKTPSTQAATENQMAESITVLNSSKDCPPTKPPCRVITLRNPILRETLKTYKEPEVPGTRETTKDSTPPSPEQETLDTQRQRPSPPDLSPLYQQVKQASPTAALAKEDLAKTESVRRQVIGGPTIAMPQFMPVTTSNSSSVSAYLNEVEKWVFQLRPSISDLEQALKTKEEECDVLAKALKESEERRETQHVSMVAELAAAVSKMNSDKEAMDAAMEEAKSSMRHLAVAEGNVGRVKEENEKLEGEIRKLKKENEKLESLAVTVEKKCKEVWGILESRR